MPTFSHLDDQGAAQMVDVGLKPPTRREARACGQIRMAPSTLAQIAAQGFAKGDVLGVARLAGVMAGKRTSDLLPLCHSLALDAIELSFAQLADDLLQIEATVRCTGRTGVEMEALTAVSVAALTVYDMCKAVDRDMVIEQVRLEAKSGGASGDYQRRHEARRNSSTTSSADRHATHTTASDDEQPRQRAAEST